MSFSRYLFLFLFQSINIIYFTIVCLGNSFHYERKCKRIRMRFSVQKTTTNLKDNNFTIFTGSSSLKYTERLILTSNHDKIIDIYLWIIPNGIQYLNISLKNNDKRAYRNVIYNFIFYCLCCDTNITKTLSANCQLGWSQKDLNSKQQINF